MEIILISILSALSIVLGFAVFNLMKKNEQQEDILVEYMKYLNKISKAIEVSDARLKKLDAQGRFQSDDEIGFFFKTVMTIQDLLNGFKIKDL
jgi:hypothetical protein|tara:strand:- start:3324 stop:3602 length:279 start_codon:yes stop_codon:yes gene_type:complete